MSSVATDSGRFSAAAAMPLFWRSSKGRLVEARWTAARFPRSTPVRQSRPASTAMVMASSSQFAMARSPRPRAARPGLNQALAAAAALRDRRSRGR